MDKYSFRTVYLIHKSVYCSLLKQFKVVKPVPVAAPSKAWVYGRSLAGIVGSKPARRMDVCLC